MDALGFISDLDSWWLRYIPEITRGGGGEFSLDMSCDETTSSPNLQASAFAGMSDLDVPTAHFIALYHAASIKALLHLSIISEAPDTYDHRIMLHAQAVISANIFVESNKASLRDGSIFVMYFPLKVVGIWSPSVCQRNDALRCIYDWGQNSGVL